MGFWFGKWWLRIWESEFKIIEIGYGEHFGEGNFGPFSTITKRKGPFWISTARPTITYLNRDNR